MDNKDKEGIAAIAAILILLLVMFVIVLPAIAGVQFFW